MGELPQVGVLARVVVVLVPGRFQAAMHNPTIETRSDEMFELWADCFSALDARAFCTRAEWSRRHRPSVG